MHRRFKVGFFSHHCMHTCNSFQQEKQIVELIQYLIYFNLVQRCSPQYLIFWPAPHGTDEELQLLMLCGKSTLLLDWLKNLAKHWSVVFLVGFVVYFFFPLVLNSKFHWWTKMHILIVGDCFDMTPPWCVCWVASVLGSFKKFYLYPILIHFSWFYIWYRSLLSFFQLFQMSVLSYGIYQKVLC